MKCLIHIYYIYFFIILNLDGCPPLIEAHKTFSIFSIFHISSAFSFFLCLLIILLANMNLSLCHLSLIQSSIKCELFFLLGKILNYLQYYFIRLMVFFALYLSYSIISLQIFVFEDVTYITNCNT